MKKVILYIAVSVFFVLDASAQANTSSPPHQAKVEISDAIEMDFTTSPNVDFAFLNSADFANGKATTSPTELSVKSNRKFKINVKADAAMFTYSGAISPQPNMPVAQVLKIKINTVATDCQIISPFSVSNFVPITNVDQLMLDGCKQGGDQKFSMYYQATPGFDYPVGTYTVNIKYTATQF